MNKCKLDNRLDWTGIDWTELNWTDLDQTRLEQTRLDWTELDNRLDWNIIILDQAMVYTDILSAYRSRQSQRFIYCCDYSAAAM